MARSRKSNTSTTSPETSPEAGRCDHVFVGGAEGVQCTTCGLKLTTEEYRELLKADN